ncbi:MAG: hypothetical protein KIT46_01300 [Anaerolineales bacterium]|nr:hypothetical protein [Anaerolineales bacterium]MCW5854659.1 hypothetical protein [Anaerolineales bacterium]
MLSKLGSYRFKVVWTVLLLALLLAACGSGASLAAPTNTPTPASGGGETGGAQNPAPEGPVDVETGLPQPQLVPPPPGSNPPVIPPGTGSPPAGAGAMLVIGGDLPLELHGGECQMLDGDTYLSIPNTANAEPPYASLIIYAGTGATRNGTLVWATSAANTDGAVVSTQDTFVITLNGDGFSGRFDGTAHRGSSGVPVQVVIPVRGVFTCVPGIVAIRGEHPMDLTNTHCSTEPFRIVVGERGGNQALFILEDGVGPGESGNAGLSWRVGGVNYVTTWMSLTRNPDGLSGSYFGEAAGPDGRSFPVSGTFNCLGT